MTLSSRRSFASASVALGEPAVIQTLRRNGLLVDKRKPSYVFSLSHSNTSELWSSLPFAFGQCMTIFWSGPMMNVSRLIPKNFLPYIDFSFQTSYVSATLLSSSASKGKLRECSASADLAQWSS